MARLKKIELAPRDFMARNYIIKQETECTIRAI